MAGNPCAAPSADRVKAGQEVRIIYNIDDTLVAQTVGAVNLL